MSGIMFRVAMVVFALAVTGATASSAATYSLDFTDDGGVVDASAIITTTGTPSGGFGEDVTAISGSVFGDMITGLFPNPNSPSPAQFGEVIYDNQFNPDPASGYVSNPGLFVTTNTSEMFNIYSNGGAPGTFQIFGTDSAGTVNTSFTNGTLTGSTVPEPASWALMMIGVAGLGATLRAARHRRTTISA